MPGEELSILNQGRKILPGPEHLQDLIDWSRDSATAIDFCTASGDRCHISYKLLDDLTSALAQRIAEALKATGTCCEGAVIPVLISQSPELYISWIAILKTGAAFCPVAIDSPAERVSFILQDVSASLVLTIARHESWLAEIAPDIPILNASQSDLYCASKRATSEGENEVKKTVPQSQSLAYIMYTSGSTGLPKGVKISHKAVCQALLAHDEYLPIFLRFLQFASPTFDVSVFETFFPLFRGATLVGRDRDSMLADLPATIRAMDVDAVELTPTVASTLLKNREAAPGLQLLLTIGEMLSKPLIEEFGESATQPGMLYAMYGPTEASIHCTIAPRVGVLSSIHNIGKPLATVTAVIIEASVEKTLSQHKILPQGHTGELAVAGQLASGYLNRSKQTAAAFVNLPGYGMFYRTGDRARVAKDGNIEMLGRISSGQVKLRGQRVELGEIESVACLVSGVVMATASIISDVLVLFCVLVGGQATVANVRKTCKKHLMSFMVPGDIKLLDLTDLPRLPSGKMDRKKIENDYTESRRAGMHRGASPMDTVTAQICRCVSEAFGRPISPATPLWAEGLHSLMAIKIVSALRFEKIEVRVRDLLELETIADVVFRVKVRDAEADMQEFSACTLIEDTASWQHVEKMVQTTLGNAGHIAYVLPCNAVQVAMLTETISNAKLNFNSIELKVVPNFKLSELRSAFQNLAQKNEILRSGFVSVDHNLMPFAQIVWHKLDLDQNLSILHPLTIEYAKGKTNTFVVQIHHALYDGWSWDLVMADLNDLLAADPIPERPQFRNVNRELRRLQHSRQERAEGYWRGLLATVTPFRLPQLDLRLHSGSKHLIERRPLQTSSHALAAFASQLHVSSQTVLSTAVSLLLGSYAGTSNVVVGLVSSGRHLSVPEIEKVVGPCLSTLPLMSDLSTMRTIQDLLLHVHGLELDLLEHGTLSLRDVLAAAGSTAQQRLFDTLFVWQESLSAAEPKTKLVQVVETRDCLDYALVIEAEPSGNEVIVKLSYNTVDLSPQCARKFSAQLDDLVATIVAKEATSLRNLWDACDSSLLAIVNPQPQMFDNSFILTSTIQDLAENNPERVAASFTHDFDPGTEALRTEDLTYGELWTQSNMIAHLLQSLDVGADDIVCLLVEKSLDLYVLDLAIIIAGGAFLNIDIRTPSGRIRQILREVKCKLIITDDGNFSPSDPETIEMPAIPLSKVKADTLQYRDKHFHRQGSLRGSCLAYAVMTSGTTGTPKAILITRENLLSNIGILSKAYPRYNDQDTLLQACSPAFDVFVFELFWAWHMGLCLSATTNDILFRDIEGFIRATRISHLSLTPSVAALIHPDNVADVKFLVTAGEPMNSKVFNDWADRGLFQGYGPAETTNICNVKGPIQQGDLINNVGPPFMNTSIFICAKQSDQNPGSEIQILPIGAVGEIVIGGEQVARGYANQSLTARSFIDTQYGRLYRSGDMGRLLANGDLILLGRDDDQVKLRGQRIELGDINTAMTRLPFVQNVVTLIIDKSKSNARLVSFWTAHNEQEPSKRGPEIYEHLEASLPPYMIPDNLLPMSAMPLTRQGKINTIELVQHFESLTSADLQRFGRGAGRPDEQEDFTDKERLIAHALSEVTDTPVTVIKPDTSFYSLGIDSISSVRFSQKLRQANVGHVDVSLILKNYSVRRLRRALVNLRSVPKIRFQSAELHDVFQSDWRSEILKMAEVDGQLVEKIVPCNALQESMLVLQTNNPSSKTYEARLEFEVRGDIHRLRTAWSHLVERHQILRTGFVITPSARYAYAQVVLKEFTLPLFTSEQSVSMYSVKSKGSISPPWRLIFDNACSGESTSLTLIMSHALYDSEALALVLREVELIYKGQEQATVVAPDSYSRYMLDMNLEEVDAFWQSRLSGYSPLSFSEAFQTNDSADNSQRTFTCTSRVSRTMLQTAAEQSLATSSNIFQSAWARLLSCYLATEDVVFGNVFSGRNLPIEGVERMIAPLFNTLPLRVRVAGRQSMRALTGTIQAAVLEMLPFQPSQLRRTVRNKKLNGQPLFDTLVLVQSGDLDLDENIWTLRKDEGNMEFPGVIIEIVPGARNNSFILMLHVQSARIDPSTAEQVLRNYDALLDEVVRYPQAQSNNFASINVDLPLLHATRITDSTPRSPHLTTEVSTNDEEALTGLDLSIRNLFAQFSGAHTAEIQKNTSIFELGIDSLHVVQIASELRALGHNVTGATVLEAQTINRLSKACKKAEKEEIPIRTSTFDLQAFDQKHRKAVLEQLSLLDEDVQAIRPCTSMQSGILTEFINSNGKLYFNSITLELRADIDLVLLRNTWHTVMDKNEMLRTGFVALNTSEHTYGMITYTESTQDLPWLIEAGSDDKKAVDMGEACLRSLQNPCWRLLLKKGTGSIRLEVHLLHSLYDVNSLDGVLSEVAAVYRNERSALRDVIAVAPALCAVLDQSEFSRQSSEAFWAQLVAGAQPSKFPDLNVRQSLERDSITVSMSSDSLLREVARGCRRLGVTLQSVCQIAWAQLLAAYTGDSKVIFGVVLSGRTLPETSHVLFPTINTVPFSIEVRDSMHDMLKEATEVNVGLYQHQFSPLTAIKRWLGVEGELYDTILVLQKTQAAQEDERPWETVDDCASAEYAISIEVLPRSNESVELRITARLDVVPRNHVTVLLCQYEALLRGVAQEQPQIPLMPSSLLSILAPKDNRIPTDIRLLHDFVEVTRMKTPDAVALEFAYSIGDGHVDKQCWNYRQLDEESNRMAHLLVAHGVKPGDFVAVCFDKCPEASFVILAVLKAGCAYVAIDPAAPIARKRFILEDAKCKVLLTTMSLVFSLQDGDKTVMLAVDDQGLVQNQPTTSPVLEREVQPSDTCYCLYTSGTTGQPKGCLITHASVVQAMLAFQRIFAGHWDKESRWLQFASFHFDVSVLEQYWSWSVGICVTSAPRDVLFENIPGAIDALQITHLDLTPSLARLLRPEQVPSLCRGVFIVGGEQVTEDIIDTWGDFGCLYNFYGPSEVTIGCTVHKRVKKGVKATNIGQPWDNVGAFVLNPGSELPVLRGAVGELCLSGPLVGKGYLNHPALTAEKFVTLKEYNVRVYRSGDLVRLLHDDSFEFSGRIDDQVKLRGQRLEIREINHAIKKASSFIVDVATVVVKHTDQPSEQLIAFFTIRGTVTKSAEITALTSLAAEKVVSQVRRHLQDKLPTYMVPTHLLPISHIPLSANNKADLKALKAYFVTMPVRSLQNMDWNGSSIVPMTKTVRRVIKILATFLGMPEPTITPSSRLFELGLDSISAVAFASVLRETGFKSADAATVMRRPVVADLAYELDTLGGKDYEQAVENAKIDIDYFRKVHREKISSFADLESFWPCTPLQEDMLSKTMHCGDTPYYLSAFHYALDKSVTLDAIRNAWTEAQRWFPILRTTFVVVSNTQYIQVVRRLCTTSIRYQTLAHGEDAVTFLEHKASEWSKRVTVLGSDPCWEVEILETSKGQLYFSLRIFHGLYDANSLSLMLKEVANVIKRGAVKSSEQNLDFHEALLYGPFCHRAGAEAFWSSGFSSPVLLDLVPISDGSENATTVYSVEYTLPEAFIATKNRLAVTESAVFQAAYLLSLHRKYNIFPTFGMVVSGRSFPMTGVEKICGPLFNTIPVQILPKEDWSLSDLISACYDFNVGAKPFEHTSLRDIKRWAGLGTGKALFDSLFVFQRGDRDIAEKNEVLWEEIGQTSTADYPLNIEVELKKGSFKLTIVVDPEFLSETDLQSISSNFLSALKGLIGGLDELLLPIEGHTLENRQMQPTENALHQGAVEVSIMNEVKSQIALLAQQEVSELSEDMNVFNLGLDSISLIKLSSALKKSGLSMSVNLIMRLATPANIAQYLTRRQNRSDAAKETHRDDREPLETTQIKLKSALHKQNISFDRIETILPVTPMQEGVLANFEKYYHFALLELFVDTDFDQLRAAWNSAIMLHSVLRTSFVMIDDPDIKQVFAQLIVVANDENREIKPIDSESHVQDIVKERRREMIEAGLNYPSFTIEFLVAADTDSRYTLLGMSHAIYDGWSIQLLHQDVANLYNEQHVQRPPIEPYLQYISSVPLDTARTFWTEQMSNYSLKPFLAPEIARVAEPPRRMTLESSVNSSTVQRFCMDHSITAQTLGLSIWTSVLSTYLKTRDICFGVVLACRDTEDADQLMFPTFNTVPFRPRFRGCSFLDLLKHVQQLSLQIAEHQGFPLKEIKKAHSGASGTSAELFDTLFVLQRRTDAGQTALKLYQEVVLGEIPKLDYPVNVEMDFGETLRWTVAANGTILDGEGVEILIDRLESTLEAMLRDPNAAIMEFHAAEYGPGASSTRPTPATTKDLARLSEQETDATMRAAIFDTVASVARCSVASLSGDTNIYSLGLDSISVIKVTGLLRKKDISLPVSKIIAAVTLDKIVSEARRTKALEVAKGPTTSRVMLLPEGMQSYLAAHSIAESAIEAVILASAGQVFMLDYYRASQGTLFYPTFRYKIPNRSVSETQILRSWDVVLRAFPALRTRFVEMEGKTWQVVIRSDAVERYPPAAHLTVSQVAGGMVVELQLHHALYDAVSLRIVIAAFEEAFQGRSIPFLHSRHSENARGIESFINVTRGDATKDARRDFWTEYLTGHTQPVFGNGTGTGTFAARRLEAFQKNALSGIDTRVIANRAAKEGVSLQALFIAAVARVYATHLHASCISEGGTPRLGDRGTETDTVVLGVYLANRGLELELAGVDLDLEDLAHPTVNVAPLVVRVDGELMGCARRVQQDLARVQEQGNCGVTLREVWEWMGGRVRVEWCVNFLPSERVPDGMEDEHREDEDGDMYGDGDGEMSGNVKLMPYPHEKRGEDVDRRRGQHQELTSPFLVGPSGSPGDMPWCVPSVDVEARLEREGGLTVGVFAPGDGIVGGEDAVLREIREVLIMEGGREMGEVR